MSDGTSWVTRAMNRKRRYVTITVAILVSIACVSMPMWLDAWVKAARRGPMHTFVLSDDIDFLAEDLALKKSRQTLSLEGLDLNHWEPVQHGRSTALNGVVDKYLNRNSLNPNRASVVFANVHSSVTRIVILELAGNELKTEVWLPK